mmetsp:Transcript_9777/g.20235  ORF Transcript_9777/g.20235 Transcript_9777/m.20235 type:complete len:246 (+) Transcript_9777:312-1049(+)
MQSIDGMFGHGAVIVGLPLVVEACGSSFKVVVQVDHEGLDAAESVAGVETTVVVGQEEAARAVPTNPEAWVQVLWLPQPPQQVQGHSRSGLAAGRHLYVGEVRPCSLEEQLAEALAHDRDSVRHADPPAVAAAAEAEGLGLCNDLVALFRRKQTSQKKGRVVAAAPEVRPRDGGAVIPKALLAVAERAHSVEVGPGAPAADAKLGVARRVPGLQRREAVRRVLVDGTLALPLHRAHSATRRLARS